MNTIGTQRQRLLPDHGGKRQMCVKMGKQRPAARRLKDKRIPKGCRINGHEQKVCLARKMAACCLNRLVGGGEMDVAIGQIDGCALKNTGRLRLAP